MLKSKAWFIDIKKYYIQELLTCHFQMLTIGKNENHNMILIHKCNEKGLKILMKEYLILTVYFLYPK